MKRLVHILTLGLMLISVFNGCDLLFGPDPDEGINIIVMVEPDTVPYFGSAIVSWNVKGGSYVRLDNLGPFDLSDQRRIDKIVENKVYNLNVYDKNDKLIETAPVAIISGDWTSSPFGLLTYGAFIRKDVALNSKSTNYEWYRYQDNSDYFNAIYDFKESIYTITFTDGTVVTHGYQLVEAENGNEKLPAIRITGADDLFILKLGVDSLILQANSEYYEDTDGNGTWDLIEPAYFRKYLVRAN